MPCKSREYGLHPKLPFPAKDLLLKPGLRVNPGLRQGAVNSVDVAHAVPWQMGGAREEASDFVVGEAVLFPDLLPDGFLSGDGQGHIYAAEGHPVYEAFPLLPLPPGHLVSECAVVEEEAAWDNGLACDDAVRERHLLRGLNRLRCVPGNVYPGIVQVPAQAGGEGIGVVPFYEDAVFPGAYSVKLPISLNLFEIYPVSWHYSAGKIFRCLFRRS